MSGHRVLALDADGVLLDYNLAYATAWRRAFGRYPDLRNPHAYWAADRWDVERLSGEALHRFRAGFDAQFWSAPACRTRCARGMPATGGRRL